ncbi:MAG: AMIN domain-containing protein, partial [Desulfofustis sp.]
CDFMGTTADTDVPELIETNGQFINRISISRQTDPDKVRVELVLVPNRHYDLQQLFFKEESLFVVIVKELQKDAGAAQAN